MGREFSRLELNYSGPLEIDGVGHVRCPTVEEVATCRAQPVEEVILYGEDAYNFYLEMFVITRGKLLERYVDLYEEEDLKEMDKLSLFTVMILAQDTREQLTESLNFFFEEEVVFDYEAGVFRLFQNYSEVVGEINDDNFIEVKNLILKRCHITPPKVTGGKRRSKRMIEFDKKVEEGRKKSRKWKNDQESMELGNIVSKVASRSNAADINDVYTWTIYQLYEQFGEINYAIQIDTILKRWSTWGKEDFDFTSWYHTRSSE